MSEWFGWTDLTVVALAISSCGGGYGGGTGMHISFAREGGVICYRQ